jgi:hypothetical protein
MFGMRGNRAIRSQIVRTMVVGLSDIFMPHEFGNCSQPIGCRAVERIADDALLIFERGLEPTFTKFIGNKGTPLVEGEIHRVPFQKQKPWRTPGDSRSTLGRSSSIDTSKSTSSSSVSG